MPERTRRNISEKNKKNRFGMLSFIWGLDSNLNDKIEISFLRLSMKPKILPAGQENVALFCLRNVENLT